MNPNDLKKLDPTLEWVDNKEDRYFPSKELVQAVRVAAKLGRPLLVMGEPGCGKTRFAGAVANQLGWNFKEWYVKSTQTASEALYSYDMVGRLRDSQLLANQAVDGAEQEALLAKTPADYIVQGELGDALTAKEDTVLLIDEIDKADRDFPNDLLLELESKRFFVEEIKKWRGHPDGPNDSRDFDRASDAELLVIITSNNERELPEPFLRRCIFFYIEFPGTEALDSILRSHLDGPHTEAIIPPIINKFEELREKMVDGRRDGDPVKPPSTSELIDWVKVLRDEDQSELLAELEHRIPYSEVLVKRWDDHLRYIQGQ